jgi:hypothetical protein
LEGSNIDFRDASQIDMDGFSARQRSEQDLLEFRGRADAHVALQVYKGQRFTFIAGHRHPRSLLEHTRWAAVCSLDYPRKALGFKRPAHS